MDFPVTGDVWSAARRRAFLTVSPLGVLGCIAGVAVQLPDVNPLDAWLLPLLGTIILGSTVLLLAGRLRVEQALAATYTFACVYFLAMLANQYHFNVGHEERLSEAVFWFPVLFCVAFLAWELPRAVIAAAVPYLLTVALTVGFIPVFVTREEWTARLGAILLQFLLANGVLIVCFTSFALLRQRFTQVRSMVYVDFLTSLPNRRFLEEHARAWDAHKGVAYAVVIFDVDHFKRVNDEHGHHVGDHVLRELALVAGRFVQDGVLLARWGGEEFVMVLPRSRAEDAAHVAERLRCACEAHEFGEVGRVTVSFGVAERAVGEAFHAALRRADAALYEAKRGGRNQVRSAALLSTPLPVTAATG